MFLAFCLAVSPLSAGDETPFFPEEELIKILATLQHPSDRLKRTAFVGSWAGARLKLGDVHGALETIGRLPPGERKQLYRRLAYRAAECGEIKQIHVILSQAVSLDSTEQSLAGALALFLLELPGTPDGKKHEDGPPETRKSLRHHAVLLVESVENPFVSSADAYRFIDRLAKSGAADVAWQKLSLIAEPAYREWGALSVLKQNASEGRNALAVERAESFSTPAKRAWAIREIATQIKKSRGDPAVLVSLLERAAASSDQIETPEERAVQLRILGREILESNAKSPIGIRLLKESQKSAASVSPCFRRLELLSYLAYTHADLENTRERDRLCRQIQTEMTSETGKTLSDRERLILLQALSQASGESNFSSPPKGRPTHDGPKPFENSPCIICDSPESRRVERGVSGKINHCRYTSFLAEAVRLAATLPDAVEEIDLILTRAVHLNRRASDLPGNDPESDRRRLPLERYEAFYYSPFTIEACCRPDAK